jgi:hypothetical protein
MQSRSVRRHKSTYFAGAVPRTQKASFQISYVSSRTLRKISNIRYPIFKQMQKRVHVLQ